MRYYDYIENRERELKIQLRNMMSFAVFCSSERCLKTIGKYSKLCFE